MAFFFFFLCGMHHYADISLQSGRFWATVIASSSERLLDLRSLWIVFITVVRGRPGGLLQSSEGEAVMILLASVSSGILAMWPNRERRRAWTIADRRGCPVVRLTSSFRTWWYHLIPNSFRKNHWSRASILSTSLFRFQPEWTAPSAESPQCSIPEFLESFELP